MQTFQFNCQSEMSLFGLIQQQNLHLYSVAKTRRAERTRNDIHANVMEVLDGDIIQIDTINQFNEIYMSLSNEYGGPGAICGYFVCANALLLEEYLATHHFKSGDILCEKDISQMTASLRSISAVDQKLHVAFDEIQSLREKFVNSHGGTETELKAALKLWVANYEVGDFLKRHSKEPCTYFVQYNQYPFRADATPDERVRVDDEEVQFGGKLGSDNEPVFVEGESHYFVQTFHQSKEFWPPLTLRHQASGTSATTSYPTPIDQGGPNEINVEIEGAMRAQARSVPNSEREGGQSCQGGQEGKGDQGGQGGPRLAVVNLQGHFVVAIAGRKEVCKEVCEGRAQESVDNVEPVLIVFNTMAHCYLDNPALLWTFDEMIKDVID